MLAISSTELSTVAQRVFLAPAEAYGVPREEHGSLYLGLFVPYGCAPSRCDASTGWGLLSFFIHLGRCWSGKNMPSAGGGGWGWPVGTSGAPCLSPFKATSMGSAGDFCPYMGSESPLAAVRPQAQKAAWGDNASSLGGDEALSVQIEPITWYPGYSPLGEQSRHKHGDRPHLAVQLHMGVVLFGTPLVHHLKLAIKPFWASQLPAMPGRVARPSGEGPAPLHFMC